MNKTIVWSVSLPLVCAVVHAKQSAPPAQSGQSIEDVRAELKRLEARLADLEKPSAVAASAQAAQEPAAAPAWKDLISEGNRVKLYGFARLDAQYDASRPNNTQTIGWILSEDPTMPAPPAGQGAGEQASREAQRVHLGRLARSDGPVGGKAVAVAHPIAVPEVDVEAM